MSNVTTRWWCQNKHILNSQSYRFIPPSQDVSSSRSFVTKNALWSLVMIASRNSKKSPHRARYITNPKPCTATGTSCKITIHLHYLISLQTNLVINPGTINNQFFNGCLVISNHVSSKGLVHHPTETLPCKKCFVFGVPGWSLYKPTPAASWDCSTLAASLGVPEFGEEFWMLKRSPLKLWNHMKLWIL